jgi:hypothetical protein
VYTVLGDWEDGSFDVQHAPALADITGESL